MDNFNNAPWPRFFRGRALPEAEPSQSSHVSDLAKARAIWDCNESRKFYRCHSNGFIGCCSVDPCDRAFCPDTPDAIFVTQRPDEVFVTDLPFPSSDTGLENSSDASQPGDANETDGADQTDGANHTGGAGQTEAEQTRGRQTEGQRTKGQQTLTSDPKETDAASDHPHKSGGSTGSEASLTNSGSKGSSTAAFITATGETPSDTTTPSIHSPAHPSSSHSRHSQGGLSSNARDPQGGLSSGAIAGIAIGAAVLLGMAIFAILRRRRRQRAAQEEQEQADASPLVAAGEKHSLRNVSPRTSSSTISNPGGRDPFVAFGGKANRSSATSIPHSDGVAGRADRRSASAQSARSASRSSGQAMAALGTQTIASVSKPKRAALSTRGSAVRLTGEGPVELSAEMGPNTWWKLSRQMQIVDDRGRDPRATLSATVNDEGRPAYVNYWNQYR